MVPFSEFDDLALVDAAARRDPDAFAELYQRHSQVVYRYAVARVGQRSLAEDIVQDVFVRLWRRPDGFDPTRGSVRTYLITLAYGRSIDVIRSETARHRREERDGPPVELDRTGDADGMDEVRTALDTLTDEQREAITLAYFLGYSYRQVAELLHVPVGTIKNRIRSGLTRLRGELMRAEATSP
jgi:RNA polymerase sigma-70 factor (ECF subfamily)